jgi:para-aminobenzoate synthetase component 1
VNRITKHYQVHKPEILKQQIVHWLNQFTVCCFFDSNHYQLSLSNFQLLAAAGVLTDTTTIKQLTLLDDWLDEHNDWIFGHLSFSLKNQIFSSPNIKSSQLATVPFPDFYFFQPEVVCTLQEKTFTIHSALSHPDSIYEQITEINLHACTPSLTNISFQPNILKTKYYKTVELLLNEIQKGNCYEINFCTEWIAKEAHISPVETYLALSALSPMPFSAYYKLNSMHLMCASPERYLCKQNNHLYSSPIKGTIARDLSNPEADKKLQQTLLQSKKERSENIMIVDLVRNDLSQICKSGTVKVTELCEIYSYPQVHQMISTITGELKQQTPFSEILKATFPMGSMTGAPKEKVLSLTKQYENFSRGLYSGSVGYFTPEKDFDFNVVIRSLQYNAANTTLSYAVGSGITAQSNPEQEYEECLLKATAMANLFIKN